MKPVPNHSVFLPFLKGQILDSARLKELADDNFRFDIKSRKFHKPVENTVGKGEIASDEQFLLFPHFLQKTSIADTLKLGLILGKG